MKKLCYQCNKNYHMDYILIIGPYWLKQHSSQSHSSQSHSSQPHLCVYCFETYYTKTYIPKITKSSQYITKYRKLFVSRFHS